MFSLRTFKTQRQKLTKMRKYTKKQCIVVDRHSWPPVHIHTIATRQEEVFENSPCVQ